MPCRRLNDAPSGHGYLFRPHAPARRTRPPVFSACERYRHRQRHLAELYSGAYKRPQPARLLALIADLLQDVAVLDFDAKSAEHFGQVRGVLLQKGIQVATADLMIASIALAHDLTLVIHNTADYQNIPGLHLDDWLVP